MCRAFASYLDRLPRIDPALTCDLDGRLAGVGITRPQWVELDPSEYRDVVYAIEMSLAPRSRGGQERLAGPIAEHPPRADGPYTIPFDRWRRNYASNVQAGHLRPRLRMATLQLSPPDPPVTVLAYTPQRDDELACQDPGAVNNMLSRNRLGDHLFPYDPATRTLRQIVSSEVVVSSRLRYRAVVFDGRAYLIGVGAAAPAGAFTVEFSRVERYGSDGPQDPLYAGYHLCGFSLAGENRQ
ncbi:MAG TPA: hypothetical protein VIS73_04545 [Rhodocyclaceae bacterium]